MVGNGINGSVGAVGGGEGIVDIYFPQFRQCGGKPGIIGLFAWVEPEIFQKHDPARLKPTHYRRRRGTNAIRGKTHRAAQCLGQGCHQGRERHVGHRLAPGSAEMAEDDDHGTLIGELTDGGGNALDACRVTDLAVFEGHVKIDADQHALARHLHVIDCVKDRTAVIHGPKGPSA